MEGPRVVDKIVDERKQRGQWSACREVIGTREHVEPGVFEDQSRRDGKVFYNSICEPASAQTTWAETQKTSPGAFAWSPILPVPVLVHILNFNYAHAT
jgi:hypothetical protein